MTQRIPDQSKVAPGLETLTLQLDADQLHAFFPLLQKGVAVPATVGCTLKSLLCDQFAIPADYVTDRITTIFLDNSPVDDLDRTIIHDGSRVTLSAAMPGLVGATMRRGGFYAALRQGISHVLDSGAAADEGGTVRIKLFNLLLAELGPLILARGLILEQGEMSDLLKDLPGQPADSPAGASRVLLTVLFDR
jgi:hypothetical protein